MKIVWLFLDIYKRFRETILYVIFGALATIVNTALYYLFFEIIHIPNVPSTIIAWILAVAFAFITNKYFVFASRSNEKEQVLKEVGSFFAFRSLTGVIDIAIMYITVDLLLMNSVWMKLIANIIATIINYVASKFIIFNNKRHDKAVVHTAEP